MQDITIARHNTLLQDIIRYCKIMSWVIRIESFDTFEQRFPGIGRAIDDRISNYWHNRPYYVSDYIREQAEKAAINIYNNKRDDLTTQARLVFENNIRNGELMAQFKRDALAEMIAIINAKKREVVESKELEFFRAPLEALIEERIKQQSIAFETRIKTLEKENEYLHSKCNFAFGSLIFTTVGLFCYMSLQR